MAPPLVVERAQDLAIVDVLPSVKQGRDALWVDLQSIDLVPEPLTHLRVGQFELGRRQLAHQQKHQLLLFAFGKGAGERLLHLVSPSLICSLATAA